MTTASRIGLMKTARSKALEELPVFENELSVRTALRAVLGRVGTRVRTGAWNSGLEGENPGYDGGMRIELITTGSELLLGQVLNSHPGCLSGRLLS